MGFTRGSVTKRFGSWGYDFRHNGKRYRKCGFTTEGEAYQAKMDCKAELDGCKQGSDIFWTEEKLVHVRDVILPKSITIADAISKIRMLWGRNISINYFATQFKTMFGVTPGRYLGNKVNCLPDETVESLAIWERITELKQEYKDDSYKHYDSSFDLEPHRKILSLSDFHIPFERDDLIREAVETHKDADILVINGDFLDAYAVSTFIKERNVLLRKEYDIGLEYLDYFRKIFRHVILVKGNHEYRINRYFNSITTSNVSFLINKEILDRLANGEVYDNQGRVVERLPFDNVHFDNDESWYCKIGKTVFAHPNSYSVIEAKTAVNAHAHFMEREDVNAIVIGHTHHQVFVPTRNVLCIEQGCMCCPLEYTKRGKLRRKPQVLGYTVIYQDEDGNCDFNKSHNVYLGTQYPIKKDFDDFLLKGS